jgi:hypothetical protein
VETGKISQIISSCQKSELAASYIYRIYEARTYRELESGGPIMTMTGSGCVDSRSTPITPQAAQSLSPKSLRGPAILSTLLSLLQDLSFTTIFSMSKIYFDYNVVIVTVLQSYRVS